MQTFNEKNEDTELTEKKEEIEHHFIRRRLQPQAGRWQEQCPAAQLTVMTRAVISIPLRSILLRERERERGGGGRERERDVEAEREREGGGGRE